VCKLEGSGSHRCADGFDRLFIAMQVRNPEALYRVLRCTTSVNSACCVLMHLFNIYTCAARRQINIRLAQGARGTAIHMADSTGGESLSWRIWSCKHALTLFCECWKFLMQVGLHMLKALEYVHNKG